jgi:ABC-type sugar transport system substrate-binding protein
MEELKDVAEFIWIGPTEDQVDKQIEMLEAIIPTQPDVIAVACNDAEAIVPVLKKAAESGIKVATWDGDANYRDFFINLVNYDVFGSALIDNLVKDTGEEADIAIITTSFTAPNQVAWIESIKKRINEAYPKIKILDVRAAGEDTQQANQVAQDLIKTNATLKGLIVLGIPNVPGALDAVKAAGKVGQIFVTGNSLPSVVRSYVKDGVMKYVELWSAPEHGYLTCYSCYELATSGLKAGKSFKAGSMGEFTPAEDDISMQISLPLAVFTAENIDNYNF